MLPLIVARLFYFVSSLIDTYYPEPELYLGFRYAFFSSLLRTISIFCLPCINLYSVCTSLVEEGGIPNTYWSDAVTDKKSLTRFTRQVMEQALIYLVRVGHCRVGVCGFHSYIKSQQLA